MQGAGAFISLGTMAVQGLYFVKDSSEGCYRPILRDAQHLDRTWACSPPKRFLLPYTKRTLPTGVHCIPKCDIKC